MVTGVGRLVHGGFIVLFLCLVSFSYWVYELLELPYPCIFYYILTFNLLTVRSKFQRVKRAPFSGMTCSSDVLGSLRLGQVCNPTVFQGTSQSSMAPAQGGGHGWRTRQPALSRNMERHADTQQPDFPQGSFGPQARIHGGSLQASDFHTLIRTGSVCHTGHNLGGAVYETRPLT